MRPAERERRIGRMQTAVIKLSNREVVVVIAPGSGLVDRAPDAAVVARKQASSRPDEGMVIHMSAAGHIFPEQAVILP